VDEHHLEPRNLLRFLRARKHSIENAENMFRQHMQWREQHDLDNLHEWKHPKEYSSYWPWNVTGFDVMDGPVMVLPIGSWDPYKVNGKYNDFVRYCYQSIEHLWKVTQRKGRDCNVHQQFSIILDIKGLGMKNVTSIEAMKGILEAVKSFEANYPETMRIGFIVNAPYMFNMAWRLIKPFVSDYTHSKLRFLGSDQKSMRTELMKHMDIHQFPTVYGGSLPVYKEEGGR